MNTRNIGPFTVSAIGLGCMNLSHAYGTPPPAEQGERVLLAALDAGVTLFDTAALYGLGSNEPLVGRVLKQHRQRITLCTKGGLAGVTGEDGVRRRVIDGRPQVHCELSALGETVNLAQRVEQLTKNVGGPVLLTEQTRSRLREPVPLSCRGLQRPAGCEGELVVYRVELST